MDLGRGVVTPGFPWEAFWNNTRKVRDAIDYRDKSVLDLGSWDGMWAFEAEMLGAALTVATDCMNYWQIPWHHGMNNLLLVREAIFSEVIPLWNVPPSDIRARLDYVIYSHPPIEGWLRYRATSRSALSPPRPDVVARAKPVSD